MQEPRVCDVCQTTIDNDDDDDDDNICKDCQLFLDQDKEEEEDRCDCCMEYFSRVLTLKQCQRCRAKFNICQWCPFYGICPPYFGCFCSFTDQ